MRNQFTDFNGGFFKTVRIALDQQPVASPFISGKKKRAKFGHVFLETFMMRCTGCYPHTVKFGLVAPIAKYHHDLASPIYIMHAEHFFNDHAVRQMIEHKFIWDKSCHIFQNYSNWIKILSLNSDFCTLNAPRSKMTDDQ